MEQEQLDKLKPSEAWKVWEETMLKQREQRKQKMLNNQKEVKKNV